MYCRNCGAELNDQSKFCRICGTPQQVPQRQESDSFWLDEPEEGDAWGEPEEGDVVDTLEEREQMPGDERYVSQKRSGTEAGQVSGAGQISRNRAGAETERDNYENPARRTRLTSDEGKDGSRNRSRDDSQERSRKRPRSARMKPANSVVKLVALILAVVYAVLTVMNIPALFQTILGLSGGNFVWFLAALVTRVMAVFPCALMAVTLFALARCDKARKAETAYLGVICASVLDIAIAAVRVLLEYIFSLNPLLMYFFSPDYSRLGRAVLGAAVTVGLLFLIFTIFDTMPIVGRSKEKLSAMLRELPEVLSEAFGGAGKANANSSAYRNTGSAAYAGTNGNMDAGAHMDTNTGSNGNLGQQQYMGVPPYGPDVPTNKSLLVYIVLTIVTCGIYGLYFIYTMARDINIVCKGDGRETAGLLKFLVFSFLTCGMYGYMWQCMFQERLASNAKRFGVTVEESGDTVMLWITPGCFLCLIGPFVALYIQIKNLNKLARAYNEQKNAGYTGTDR